MDEKKEIYVLIVEDDIEIAEAIKTYLTLGYTNVRITLIHTLSDFIDKFSQIVKDKPDIILMDIMLIWTNDKNTQTKMPDDVYRGGLKCLKLLQSQEKTKYIPVVIISALRTEDFINNDDKPINWLHVRKPFSPIELESAIKSMLPNSLLENKGNNKKRKLLDVFTLKPELFGFAIDLKKVFSLFQKKK
jgi:CheY-like chemotaxis protein